MRATRLPVQGPVPIAQHIDGIEEWGRKGEKIANELFPIDGETAAEDQCPTRILDWKVWAFLTMDVTGGLDAYYYSGNYVVAARRR